MYWCYDNHMEFDRCHEIIVTYFTTRIYKNIKRNNLLSQKFLLWNFEVIGVIRVLD